MLQGTAHFSFTVKDLKRSVAFYQGILGLEIVRLVEREGEDISRVVAFPKAHLKEAFLKLPGSSGVLLELIEYVSPTGQAIDMRTCNPGAGHICFTVDDMAATYTTLRARGVQFKSEPVSLLAGMNKGGFAVYFVDPDGITLELYQAPKKG